MSDDIELDRRRLLKRTSVAGLVAIAGTAITATVARAKESKAGGKAPQLPPPGEAEIKGFFAHRSQAMPVKSQAEYKGPAVYFLRQKGGKPMPRWLGPDDCGLLFVGSSGSGPSGMSMRSRQMAAGNHGAVTRLATLIRQCEPLGQKEMDIEYFFVPVSNAATAKFWESFILLSYCFQFGDRPPLNDKFEYCYVKSPHHNREDSVAEWKSIRSFILA